MNKKPVYIMSLEASDIYYHNHRDMKLKREYLGMIPYSLELIKLNEVGLKSNYIERRDKYTSNDIINVKFNSKVKNADDMLDIYKRRVDYAKDEHVDSLNNYIELLSYHSSISDYDDEYWDELPIDELRHNLYTEGFKIEFKNSRTGSVKVEEYVVYKRSSAKSRTGQCLFIKKKLYNKMIKWSRMGLNLRKGQSIDLASLLAYESLVGSSLEDTITIPVDNILIVDDVESKFNQLANVVRTDKTTGFLNSFKEECEITNSLFDGESLLDHSYFQEDKAMILLRNHMFKSASFNTNLQLFFKDNCPVDIEYDEWKIKNMYGQEILAKDIHMVITPSSLKALKFAHTMPDKSEVEMWEHWKQVVKDDAEVFGICKNEKKSKVGYDEDGDILQQTSYQMINCLPADLEDINELTKTEIKYIERLKQDDEFLMEDILKSSDKVNSNKAIVDLYNHNNELMKTTLFRTFKSRYINKKVSHAKKGKIKIKGDYCVLLGNPIEFLFHSIGIWDRKSILDIKYNEVFTNLYVEGKEMIGFRNPNTSPSNVLIMNNVKSSKIDKYFNLSKNIIAVNAIEFALQDILSGCDYDSDTLLVSAEDKLVQIGKRCFGHYLPCINRIDGKKKKYHLSKEHHYEIDKQLANSQYNIGRVVNLGQFSMSTYWDLINKNISNESVDELLKKVDVMTVLSGIAIDMAKKFYDIDMDSEILNVSRNEQLKIKDKKPNFWIHVSQNKNIRNKLTRYNCPMDYLIESLDNIKISRHIKTVNMDEFINEYNMKEISNVQLLKVKSLIEEYNNESLKFVITSKENKESHNKTEDLTDNLIYKISKLKLKEPTVAYLLLESYNEESNFLLKTLKMMNECHKEVLMNVIKNNIYNYSLEVWKDVVGFEHLYEISSHGNIRNKKTNLYMTKFLDDKGYYKVRLSSNYDSRTESVHRLVGFAFINNSNPNERNNINHIDENKINNNVNNLEWCTHIENLNHGTRVQRIADKNSIEVNQLDLNGDYIKTWKSAREVERKLGIGSSHITAVCKGKVKTAGGYIWEYNNK